MKKVILGGVLGGVVLFIWGALSHMVLPIGEMGIQSLPAEEALLPAMRSAIHSPGLYFFPGMGAGGHPSPEEQKAWEEKYEAGPTGILVYHPGGQAAMDSRQMLTELASDSAAARS